MKILTGNDLKTGEVTWWTGEGWSLHIEQAVDVGEHGEEIAARENALRNVVAPYVIDGQRGPEGVRPAHIQDRIRALGPTVRLDLSLKPADPAAGTWVI